jgi:hypothetical protein
VCAGKHVNGTDEHRHARIRLTNGRRRLMPLGPESVGVDGKRRKFTWKAAANVGRC